ncbi:MAG TPA: SURF1 family protein [Gemmatimonadaceae bacterium]|nr:SURF1 family protein [Gemmatimonadaceae bacterium]
MKRRNVLAAILAIVTALSFSRLGVWQLQRLGERRARNDALASRLHTPALPLSQLPADSAGAHWRRALATGSYDFDHQIVLSGRTHDGSPGVQILTPLHPESGGPAVLVNRGWVYSPDAASVDLGKWDEPPHATVSGYVEDFVHGGRGIARLPSHTNAWTRLDADELRAAFPFPIAPYYLVELDTLAAYRAAHELPTVTPVRLELPQMDDGPHLGYAIQWFTFAAVALVGVGTLIAQDARRGPRPPDAR